MWDAWLAAFRGLVVAWRSERHLKLHSMAGFIVISIGFWVGLSALEWAILALTVGFVVAMEYMNSALERLADRVSTERHPLIRDAKDFAAAGVLVAALAAVAVGSLILLPKIWTQIF